jgi:hypothetical protein
MTTYRAVGQSISGDSIFYFVRRPPTVAQVAGGYSGSLDRGWAAVDVPLRAAPVPGLGGQHRDKIVFRTASYACNKKPDISGKKEADGGHTGYTGYLKGNATVTVVTEKQG